MVGITELSVLRFQKPPASVTGTMDKQGPGFCALGQVYPVIYFTADKIYPTGAKLSFG